MRRFELIAGRWFDLDRGNEPRLVVPTNTVLQEALKRITELEEEMFLVYEVLAKKLDLLVCDKCKGKWFCPKPSKIMSQCELGAWICGEAFCTNCAIQAYKDSLLDGIAIDDDPKKREFHNQIALWLVLNREFQRHFKLQVFGVSEQDTELHILDPDLAKRMVRVYPPSRVMARRME